MQVGASPADIERVVKEETEEMLRRVQTYRGGRPHVSVKDRTAIVVDDGLATGVTAQVALQALRKEGARQLVLAVPVGSPSTVKKMAEIADKVICLMQPAHFRAVGQFYQDFSQTTDEEVITILRRAAEATARAGHKVEPSSAEAPMGPETCQMVPDTPDVSGEQRSTQAGAAGGQQQERPVMAPTQEEVEISEGTVTLGGTLTIPPDAIGMVVFAHGSGSGRHSPRNRMVASVLNSAGENIWLVPPAASGSAWWDVHSTDAWFATHALTALTVFETVSSLLLMVCLCGVHICHVIATCVMMLIRKALSTLTAAGYIASLFHAVLQA